MTTAIANTQPSSDLMLVASPPHIASPRYGYEISRVAFPTQEEWMRLQAYAKLAVSAQINKTITNEAQAMVVALKGWHLGIDPMEAFQQIVIIDNKTTIQVQLMIALANRSGKLLKFDIPDPAKAFEERKATVTVIRKDRPEDIIQATFTMDDAQRANLMGKFIWKQYPGPMLVNRAVAIALRRAIPEDLGLMHATEEIETEEKTAPTASQSNTAYPTITASVSTVGQSGASEDNPPWWTNSHTIAELVKRAIEKGFIEKNQGAKDLLNLIGTENWQGFESSKEAGLAILAAVEKLKTPPQTTEPVNTEIGPAQAEPLLIDNTIQEVAITRATYNGEHIVFQTLKHGPVRVFSRGELAKMVGDEFAERYKIKSWTGTGAKPTTYEFAALILKYQMQDTGYYKVVEAKPDPEYIPF